MKTETPRARLKRLRAELYYIQQMNRVEAGHLRAGIAKAKRIGQEMRRCRSQS